MITWTRRSLGRILIRAGALIFLAGYILQGSDHRRVKAGLRLLLKGPQGGKG